MASKTKQKQSTKQTQKKATDAEVADLRKENVSLKLEISILRNEFDPAKPGIKEQTLIADFEDTIKRLEVELNKLEVKLKEAQENRPKSSTENNDKSLKEIQEKYSKEINELKRGKADLDETNKKLLNEIEKIKATSSAITKERDDLKEEVERLKKSADKQQSAKRNVSADFEKEKKEIEDLKVNLRTITAERDDYEAKLKKSETLCKEKDNKISELQTRSQRESSPDKYPTTATDDSKDTEQEKKNDAENTTLKKQISGLEGEIKSLNEKLTTESDKNVAMEKQISDIEENNKSLNQKLTEEREEIESLKRGKELMEKKNDELRSELKEEKDAKASMQKDLSKAKDNLKNANTQIQNTSASSSNEELKKENEDNKKKVAELQSKIADLKKKNNMVEPRGPSSSGEVSKLRKEIISLKDENDHLKTRLSELVGAKLTENNPDIADLSDMNRPQKLGEMYSELYDNEWTDAFEEIETSGESESVVIKHLHTILWEASAFCEDLSFQYTKKLDSVLFRIPDGKENNVETSEMPVTIRKQIKDLRKGISPFLKADVSEKYVLTSKEKKIGVNLKQFMKRCAELCWLMRMQDPPVVLTKKNNAGPFNGDLYRTYTKSGKTVDFVVWPPLLLHDNGPTLAKGVAQGK